MNFFEQQDKTKKTTKKLFGLFALAVLAISFLNYIAVFFYMSSSPLYKGAKAYYDMYQQSYYDNGSLGTPRFFWFDPKLFIYTTGITILVIVLVSWIKKTTLRKGGQSIAEMMGGQRIAHDTQDFSEKRLLNVVEEIALASGVVVPDVYILEEEGINAFAAGYTIDDAVIGVTRGCIQSLTRDELQGVIAHEFSHIFHGDMNINLHLISLLHGILFLHYIGKFIVRGSGRQSNKSGGSFLLGGLVLMLVGYVGFFFGRLIQSAVSRQREYLADASAVQYTRNPHGIAGALAKIGGFTNQEDSRSILEHQKTDQVEHMMFSLAVAPSFFQMFATHPPIEKRIKAIDPSFNFTQVHQNFITGKMMAPDTDVGAMGFASQDAAAPQPFENHALIAQEHGFLDELDQTIYKACHHPQKAKALLYLLALDENLSQLPQATEIISAQDPYILHVLDDVRKALTPKDFQHRIELFDLCMPSLRRLTKQDYKVFSKALLSIVKMDQEITLSEWVFVEMVKTHLHAYFYPQKTKAEIHKEFDVIEDVRIILSAVAYAGQDASAAQLAFDKGFSIFGQPETSMMDQGRLSLSEIATSFRTMQKTHPKIKSKMIEAMRLIVLSDEKVTWEEFELYRAFSDGLGNPIAPLLMK